MGYRKIKELIFLIGYFAVFATFLGGMLYMGYLKMQFMLKFIGM